MPESGDEEQRWYDVGRSSGLEEAGVYVLGLATKLFQRGDDKMARKLRDIAEELKRRGEKAHPGPREGSR